ncbi:hypothetical protein CFOLD11_40580 [Clostridium folliculivorans]|uniref:Glycosyltransferase subfamily 4-like N-terminal domain-containing protein n=1 Tax=Clostridium folliculivorans TaxID=2886038 RepID=A0A9W5Y5R6_9CLOT|nr:glycosyltransferase [Clostridium folliculivorans]GKU27231.1 hypothetical protein CFOLD11_40580 [Clostridium folliculivorans]
MKHIIVIAGWYYPEPSPTGNCIKQIINELKRDNRISVICFGESENILIEEDGVSIYTLSNLRLRLRRYALKELQLSYSKYKRQYFNILYILSRVFRVFISIFAWPTSESWYISKSLKLLIKINTIDKIDTIITVSNPFEAHMCGFRYKKLKPKVNWITYSLDHFTNSESLHRYYFSRNLKFKINLHFEKRIYEYANYNFVTKELKPWVDKITNGIEQKVKAVSFPLLKIKKGQPKESYFSEYRDNINLVYAGALYKKIRNPEYLLKLICGIDDERIVLHLFSRGDCDNIINRYKSISKDKIVVHKVLPIDEIHDVMEQADILVNLGNCIYEQKPSKIYEYIATGKPIVNIHYNAIDYSDIFSNYPLSININQENICFEKDRYDLREFCNRNWKVSIDKNDIKNRFVDSTPEFISDLFKRRIEEN